LFLYAAENIVTAKPRRARKSEKVLADWLDEDEVADETGKTVRTLRSWRKQGKGPPYTMFGRTAKYHKDALQRHYLGEQITPVRTRHPREGPRRSDG
jgi:hypothetical protein